MTAEESPPAIVAEGVRRAYGDAVALDGVSLSVAAGEVFALVGPNGAGKTTLIRALTGTTRAEGWVELLGVDPRKVDPARVGLLPQEFDPPGRLTARELLQYYGGLYDESRTAEAVLGDVGLDGAADARYENLSGGQRRRVCVGTALVNAPDVLFLDEPTTGIDPVGQRAVWGLVEDLAAGGATVLITTHDMVEAERLADRVGLLADGELVAVDAPGALVDEYGGHRRLEVRTRERVAARRALETAGYEPSVEGRKLAVRGIEPSAVGDAVTVLDDAGVAYDAVSWRKPDLEDAYLRLTGTDVTKAGEPRSVGAAGEAAATTGDGGAGDGTADEAATGNGRSGSEGE